MTRSSLNTRLIWGLMLFLVGVDAVWLKLAGLSVYPKAIGATMFHVLCMALLALFYTYWRKDARIAALAHSIAAFMGFTAVTIILSYLTVALHRPLIDDYLVAADRAMGLDWPSSYHWVVAHPLIYKILFVAYASLIPQMILLIVLLNFYNMQARCWEMLWLFMGACIGCLFFSALWPAIGAFGYFHIEGKSYVEAFRHVYDGSLTLIGKDPVEGIIQFPSLHVALGVIYAYAARGFRFLFPAYIVLNVLLIVASQSVGGHHFADLWGGALLALLLIAASRKAKKFTERFKLHA